MPWTYIVRCADDTYYVGSTRDLEGRLWQHNNSDLGASYTRRRRPVTLVWSGWFERIDHAWAFEKQVQGWNRRKREALIRGDFEVLPALPRRSAVQRRAAREDGDDGGFEARR